MNFLLHLWVVLDQQFPMPLEAEAKKKFNAYVSTPNHYHVEVWAKAGTTARDVVEAAGLWVRVPPSKKPTVAMLHDNWSMTKDETYALDLYVYSQDKKDATGKLEEGAIAICWRMGASTTWHYGTFSPPNPELYFHDREVMKLNILNMQILLSTCMQTYDEEVDSDLYMIYPRKGTTLKE